MSRLYDRTVTVVQSGGYDADGDALPARTVRVSRPAVLDMLSSVESPGDPGVIFGVETRYRLIFEPGGHVRELDPAVSYIEVSGETDGAGKPTRFRLLGRPEHITRGITYTAANLQLVEVEQ